MKKVPREARCDGDQRHYVQPAPTKERATCRDCDMVGGPIERREFDGKMWMGRVWKKMKSSG